MQSKQGYSNGLWFYKASAGGDGHFDDLARFRQQQGMPKLGSPEDAHTASKLVIDNKDFYGRNGHGLHNEIKDSMTVNAQTATHAEGQSFYEAYKSGVRADKATLYVDRELCDSCGYYGGVRSLAKQLEIQELTIITPGKEPIVFNPFIKPKPNPFKK